MDKNGGMMTTPRPEQGEDRVAQMRVPAWVIDVTAAIVVIVTSMLPAPRPPMFHAPGGWWFAQALAILPVIVVLPMIPLRRRWPTSVLIASVAIYGATVVADHPVTGAGIVAILAVYSLAARATRFVTLISGGAATVFVAILSVTVSNFGVVDPRVFQIAAGIAVAAALGDSTRSHRELMRSATERAIRAEQTREAEAQRRVAEERLRIAQDLHDTVAHQISVISLNAGVAEKVLETNPAKALESLKTIRAAARGTLSEISSLMRYLRTTADATLAPRPQPLLADLPELLSRFTAAGLTVDFHETEAFTDMNEAVQSIAYRVIQEGLTNAHKHGSGNAAKLRLNTANGMLAIQIENPVSPDHRNQPAPLPGGLGLTGVRERVASVGGHVTSRIEHDDLDGQTFILRVELPKRGRNI